MACTHAHMLSVAGKATNQILYSPLILVHVSILTQQNTMPTLKGLRLPGLLLRLAISLVPNPSDLRIPFLCCSKVYKTYT